MKSRSISKVLQYLDLSMQRIGALYVQGDVEEVEERLAMVESICIRTLEQVESVRRFAAKTEAANSKADEDAVAMSDMKSWLDQLPTATGNHDG